jgi:hypothetical protein
MALIPPNSLPFVNQRNPFVQLQANRLSAIIGGQRSLLGQQFVPAPIGPALGLYPSVGLQNPVPPAIPVNWPVANTIIAGQRPDVTLAMQAAAALVPQFAPNALYAPSPSNFQTTGAPAVYNENLGEPGYVYPNLEQGLSGPMDLGFKFAPDANANVQSLQAVMEAINQEVRYDAVISEIAKSFVSPRQAEDIASMVASGKLVPGNLAVKAIVGDRMKDAWIADLIHSIIESRNRTRQDLLRKIMNRAKGLPTAMDDLAYFGTAGANNRSGGIYDLPINRALAQLPIGCS